MYNTTMKTGDPLTEPDQMLPNPASDQGLHCLQIVQPFSFRNIYIIYSLKYLKLKMDSSNI